MYNTKNHPKFKTGVRYFHVHAKMLMCVMQEMTEDQVLAQFLKTFDAADHPDGVITWGEFLNYYSGV